MVNCCTSTPLPPRKEVIAYHGWGFEASCWRDWQTRFEQHGWCFKAFDRGYWQQPVTPTFNPDAQTKLLLVHSYGLHLCPIEQLQQANVLVILSSFVKFHPTAEPFQRRSQKMLQQMIDQFMLNPQRVLCNFQIKCCHPCAWQGTLSASVNPALLLRDLKDLQTAALDLALLQPIPQILILQGDQDRIVPSASSCELVEQLSANAKTDDFLNHSENCTINRIHQIIETAGHALPFTHFDCCWLKLHNYLEII
jgi:pimeloyl-[acyl-carrier protein] methyl ester esterase